MRPRTFLGDRQFQEERRAVAAVGDDPDAAVHPRDQLAGDVEAPPRSPDSPREVGGEPEELLEDPVLLGGRDAQPLVADAESDAAAAAADLQLDSPAVR